MPSTAEQPDADQVAAVCTRGQAEVLVRCDHHRVRVGERWGILLTYHLMPLEDAVEPLVVRVVFNPSRQHLRTPEAVHRQVFAHPPAPEDVQRLVDRLAFD